MEKAQPWYQQKHKKVGENKLGGITIDIVDVEPCYRLTQHSRGLPITCQCAVCKKRGQTPEEAKAHLDAYYKKCVKKTRKRDFPLLLNCLLYKKNLIIYDQEMVTIRYES